MSKKKKLLRDGLKLLLIGVLAYPIGYFVGYGAGSIGLGELSLDFIMDFINENIIVIQLALIVFLYIPAVVCIRKGKRYFKQANQMIDVEEDIHEKKADTFVYFAQLFTRLFMILWMTLFFLSLDLTSDNMVIPQIIYVVFLLLAGMNEIIVVRMVQTQDPTKKGDPISLKFNNDYFLSLDEAEKSKIYKASRHTFIFMEFALIGLMLVAFILKIIFDQGNGPIIMITLAWSLQSIVYFYFAKKFDS